jgi:hypothetical protein
MKIDGRTFEHKTVEQIRLMAVQRAVIASFGPSRTTIPETGEASFPLF